MNYEESTTNVEELISTRVRKQVITENQISLDKHIVLRLKNMCAYTGPPNPTLGQIKARIKSLTD